MIADVAGTGRISNLTPTSPHTHLTAPAAPICTSRPHDPRLTGRQADMHPCVCACCLHASGGHARFCPAVWFVPRRQSGTRRNTEVGGDRAAPDGEFTGLRLASANAGVCVQSFFGRSAELGFETSADLLSIYVCNGPRVNGVPARRDGCGKSLAVALPSIGCCHKLTCGVRMGGCGYEPKRVRNKRQDRE